MNLTERLEAALEWSAPQTETTSRGPAKVRRAEATGAFWQIWKMDKTACQALGISPNMKDNRWTIRWYLRDEPQPAPAIFSAPSTRLWSDEQKAIFSWFASGQGSLVIRARAGTGKTTTIKEAFSHAKEDRMLYAVFNKKNQVEASESISDPRVEIKTLHSVGYMFIKQVWADARPDDDVEIERVETACGGQAPASVKTQVYKLVGFAKNSLVNPSLADVAELADERDIECPEFEAPENGGWDQMALAKAALEVLKASRIKDQAGRISFNDMVWLPVAQNWVRQWFDLVVVDEAQDMNLPQLLMAKGACKAGGRVCVVGDDRQAIYHFRGAASDGIDMMKTSLSAAELGLTTTYRCPKAVVAIAATIVPDYKAADSAPEGLVEQCPVSDLENRLAVGDAVLSRTNAKLMPVCLALLRKGTPARIEGRDIGKALMEIFKKINARSVPSFLAKVEAWREKQINRHANGKKAEAKIQQITDTAETLLAIADGVSGVSEIEARLQNLFQDSGPTSRPAVILSTVHKAKGLEWKRVFLLAATFNRKRPVNAPPISPDAEATLAHEEANIYYVAMTRSKDRLTMAS